MASCAMQDPGYCISVSFHEHPRSPLYQQMVIGHLRRPDVIRLMYLMKSIVWSPARTLHGSLPDMSRY